MAILHKRWQHSLPTSYKLQDGSTIEATRIGDFIVVEVPDHAAGGFRAKYRFRYPKIDQIQTFSKPVPVGLTKSNVKTKSSKVAAKKVVKKVVKKRKV